LVTGSDDIHDITIYGDQIYWAGNNSGVNAIRSANLDGTNLVDLVTGLTEVNEARIQVRSATLLHSSSHAHLFEYDGWLLKA
jgi:ABC-type molybdate transport system ATPase subunit